MNLQRYYNGFLLISCLIVIAEMLGAVCPNNGCSVHSLFADRPLHKAGLLNNFRVSFEPYMYEIIPEPTRQGLDQLLFSTSEQLTEKELTSLQSRLQNPAKLLILDLRSDMHGFINGEPVQFDIHQDLTDKGVQSETEQRKKLAACSTMYLTDRNRRGIVTSALLVDVENVRTEDELTRSLGYEYQRFPVDSSKPLLPAIIDQFIAIVDQKTQDYWIHLHDCDGLLTSSIFFVMADILKNAHQVSFDDILLRHVAFGGVDFTHRSYVRIITLLKQFYHYALAHAQNNGILWSEWLKNNQ